MTRVSFYLLPHADEAKRLIFACQLAEKASRLGNRLLVNTASHSVAQQLDRLLWDFRADSFVPHELLPAGKLTPVHIGWGEDSPQHHDLLINLGNSIPGFFSRFERVAEIVTQDSQLLAQSRERYRFYRERGYELDTVDMGKRA